MAFSFTLKHMFLLIAAISFSLYLATSVHPAQALIIIVCIASSVVFSIPNSMRRSFFYGGLYGVLLGFAISWGVLTLAFVNHPRDPVIYGPRGGQLQFPRMQREIQERLNPYIVTLGFVVGATAGLLWVNSRSKTLEAG